MTLQALTPGPSLPIVFGGVAPQLSGSVTESAIDPAPPIVFGGLPPVLTGFAVPVITVTVEPDNLPPRVRIEVANEPGASIQITRMGADGFAVPVRQGNPAVLVGGATVLYDYEAPFNQPVTYTFGGTATVGPVIVPSAGPWLIHPGVPSLSMRCVVKLLDDEVMGSAIGVFNVPGREFPITVAAGMRYAPTSSLQLRTSATTEKLALDQLFKDQSPLLLQVVYPAFTDESDYKWLVVGDLTRQRQAPQNYGNTVRYWIAPYWEVDAPVGPVQSQRTYATTLAEAPTYADALALYPTYRDRLTGIASA